MGPGGVVQIKYAHEITAAHHRARPNGNIHFAATPFPSHNLAVCNVKHLSFEQRSQPVVFAAGDEHLSALNAVEHEFLPPGVQLAEHIIQQQHRIFAHSVFVNLPLSQLDGQRSRPGLPLGRIGFCADATDEHRKIVFVRPGQAQPGRALCTLCAPSDAPTAA